MPAKKQTPISNVLKYIQNSQKIKRKGKQVEKEAQEDADAEIGDDQGVYDDADEDAGIADVDGVDEGDVEDDIEDVEADMDGGDDMSDESGDEDMESLDGAAESGEEDMEEVDAIYIENMEKNEDFYRDEYLTFPPEFSSLSVEQRLHLLHEHPIPNLPVPSQPVHIYHYKNECVQTIQLAPPLKANPLPLKRKAGPVKTKENSKENQPKKRTNVARAKPKIQTNSKVKAVNSQQQITAVNTS